MTKPIRMCLGCGIKLERDRLARFTVASGQLIRDLTKKSGGRGVYCCKTEQCSARMMKNRKRLMQALRVTDLELSGTQLLDMDR